jgi:hypothetical protein
VAQTTVTPFLVFPTLTPVYTWRVVAQATNRTISRHQNLALAIQKAETLNRRADPEKELCLCCADLCRAQATVMEIETGQEFCLAHFREVGRD